MCLVIAGQKSSSSWSLNTSYSLTKWSGLAAPTFHISTTNKVVSDWLQTIPGTATRLQDRLQRICLPVNTKSGGIHIMADLFVDWGQRRRGPVNKVGKSGCRSGLGGLEKHYCRLLCDPLGNRSWPSNFIGICKRGLLLTRTGRSTTLALTCLGLAQSAKDIT